MTAMAISISEYSVVFTPRVLRTMDSHTLLHNRVGIDARPFLMTSNGRMWTKVGGSQFDAPMNNLQVLRGHVGFVLPDREARVAGNNVPLFHLQEQAAYRQESSGSRAPGRNRARFAAGHATGRPPGLVSLPRVDHTQHVAGIKLPGLQAQRS